MTEHRMDAEDLGALITQVLGQCFDHPEIAMHNVVLHPVGGPKIDGHEQLVADEQANVKAKRAAAAAD
jgi:hypothetical protein